MTRKNIEIKNHVFTGKALVDLIRDGFNQMTFLGGEPGTAQTVDVVVGVTPTGEPQALVTMKTERPDGDFT